MKRFAFVQHFNPVVQFLTLPFIFATYGVVIVLINAGLFWFLSALFPSLFAVNGLPWALLGGVVIGLGKQARPAGAAGCNCHHACGRDYRFGHHCCSGRHRQTRGRSLGLWRPRGILGLWHWDHRRDIARAALDLALVSPPRARGRLAAQAPDDGIIIGSSPCRGSAWQTNNRQSISCRAGEL